MNYFASKLSFPVKNLSAYSLKLTFDYQVGKLFRNGYIIAGVKNCKNSFFGKIDPVEIMKKPVIIAPHQINYFSNQMFSYYRKIV